MQAAPLPPIRRAVPVLAFDKCVLSIPDRADETFPLDLVCDPGELIVFYTDDEFHEEAVVRAACGLAPPRTGAVRFLDRDWAEMSPDLANAYRGRIGIVFRDDRWTPYQTVMQGIMLPQLHHTRRPYDDIRVEATHWATRFGLPGLPQDLPSAVSARDRMYANLVRAFMGAPALIFIEHQRSVLSPRFLQTLVNAVRDVREHGTVVLWLTQDPVLGMDKALPATRRVRLGNSGMETLDIAT